ncbi:sugar kinase [Yoonia vestfoldensis]|jgi:2-dehydro-3-deoxygluconokinase|uniref:2-dehydro-3-deoxygluconokinase n=1 Tax=Yoonia vestfoldensis TaxID=245188 RepID=A0A1Y0ECY4_9RHOB|nr:sugar kinase [Yoonia vestfoldensis]ARU01192.1 2-dehydro-3-deoxygluconokinase [Yoonia vestfoldensis]
MTRIVAIGEAMVELAPAGADDLYRAGFAGDTLNTAWYLRKLLPASDQIAYFTALGQDALSDKLLAFIAAAGLDTAHIAQRDDSSVGLYMISLTNGERSFSYWRGQSAARRMLADDRALRAALQGADLAYLSGITLAILPPEARARLFDLLRDFRQAGGKVAFDPNLRPRLWPDPKTMTETVMQAAALSDIALPSFEDEAGWFNDPTPAATARRYREAGVALVVVKNGADPMILATADQSLTLTPPRVTDVVDTTAAGDSFNAGFLASYLQQGDLEQAGHAGASLAAAVIGQIGALVALDHDA